jgi:hypothetical protein
MVEGDGMQISIDPCIITIRYPAKSISYRLGILKQIDCTILFDRIIILERSIKQQSGLPAASKKTKTFQLFECILANYKVYCAETIHIRSWIVPLS